MTTTYYLSGPMRGLPDYNYPTFLEVEAALDKHLRNDVGALQHSYRIINPARNFDGDTSRDPVEYMTVDLAAVIEADIIVLLPGWEKSEGAGHEVALATWLNKQFVLAKRIERACEVEWQFPWLLGAPERNESPRTGVLTEAKALITGDRNNSYGPPTQDFARTAGALNAYGYRGPDGRELQAHDIALFIMAVKMSRLMWTPAKRDSWVDVAGYAGCGYECAIEEDCSD
jgi:hypothetical protein